LGNQSGVERAQLQKEAKGRKGELERHLTKQKKSKKRHFKKTRERPVHDRVTRGEKEKVLKGAGGGEGSPASIKGEPGKDGPRGKKKKEKRG